VPPNPSTSVAAIVPSGNVGRTTGSYATPTWSVYYGQIDSIRADSERAQAELDNLKLHHQLDEARKGNFSTTDGAPAQTNGMSFPTMPMAAPVAPAVESGPQRSATVDTVAMVDDHWTATVSLPSGGHVTVREGSNVPGLGKVTSIALSQVLVVANNKTIPLAFTNAAEDTNSPSPTSYSRSNSLPMGIAPPIGLH
jgi:type IV pilus biogenesis protein PilP